jgi:plasmid stabilization system protein ParE
MALEIVWSKRAEKGFDDIVAYLEKKWTEKEVKAFIQESQIFMDLLKKNPGMLKISGKANLYRGPLNKFTIVTCRVNILKNRIELVNIRSSWRKPLK